nr:hypothetical protein CFP56_16863 [Quercus suber]
MQRRVGQGKIAPSVLEDFILWIWGRNDATAPLQASKLDSLATGSYIPSTTGRTYRVPCSSAGGRRTLPFLAQAIISDRGGPASSIGCGVCFKPLPDGSTRKARLRQMLDYVGGLFWPYEYCIGSHRALISQLGGRPILDLSMVVGLEHCFLVLHPKASQPTAHPRRIHTCLFGNCLLDASARDSFLEDLRVPLWLSEIRSLLPELNFVGPRTWT